jgi:two-component system chemotaxis response regulator CheY
MKDKVLFVDDVKLMKKIVKQALDKANIEIDMLDAADGKEALDILAKEFQEVKLILTDWNMPVMNGFELLTAVKSSNEYKHIPVIMMTTEAEKDHINKAINAGAENYLIKPFNNDELRKKVAKVLGKDT